MSIFRDLRHRRSLIAGRYLILGELGSGGMGTVFKARDRRDRRVVAIKFMHPHLRRDPAFAARFRREAQIARRLDSRHIIQVLDVGRDGDTPFIVMEFVEGASLNEMVKGRPLPLKTALQIAIQVAWALEEAHSKGVIHRDIKPRNILIEPNGNAKVADFGIARAEDSPDHGATETDQMGAAPFMAPERFNPARFGGRADARCDIYSLAAVLYEMLTGKVPFSGDTFEVMRQVMEDEPEPLERLRPDLDPDIYRLVHASLMKQPAARPQTAFEVRQALEPFLEQLEDQERRAFSIDWLTRPLTRLRQLVLGGVGALLGVSRLGLIPIRALGALSNLGAGRASRSFRSVLSGLITLTGGARRALSTSLSLVAAFGRVLKKSALSFGALAPRALASLLRRLLRFLFAILSGPWRTVILVKTLASTALRSRKIVYGTLTSFLIGAVLVALAFALNSQGEQVGLVVKEPSPATAVTAISGTPVMDNCPSQIGEPLASFLSRCQGAQVEFRPICSRGTVCTQGRLDGSNFLTGVNDATVAFVDSMGKLAIQRENGAAPVRLMSNGLAEQPAWSPDGRYLAYVATGVIKQGSSPTASLYGTQLRVIDPDAPEKDGILVASSELEGGPAWQRRTILRPRWSADSKAVYFLWELFGEAGGRLYQVDVPFQNGRVDFGALQKELPLTDFLAPSTVSVLGFSAADLGYPRGFLGDFAVRPNGEILFQFCESSELTRRCGLARWDGFRASVLLPFPNSSFLFDTPELGPSGEIYGYAYSFPRNDRLVKVDPSGTTTKVVDIDRDLTPQGPFTPSFAVSRDGTSILMETAADPRTLSLVRLSDGQRTPWAQGHSPAWFVAVQRPQLVPTPQLAPFTTPTATATPTPTRTPTRTPTLAPAATAFRPMTVVIDVKRGGAPVSGAKVTATAESQECATGVTDTSGSLRLIVPATAGSPAACSRPDAVIGLAVDSQTTQSSFIYSPQAIRSLRVDLQ